MKSQLAQKIYRLTVAIAVNRNRFAAVFFLAGFIAGVLVPPASAYAAIHRPDPSNPHIKKDDAAARNKEPKQNYPGGTEPAIAGERAAADAVPIIGSVADTLTQRNAPKGEVLRNAESSKKIEVRELVEKRTATSSISVNTDGSLTEKQYFAPKHFKKDGKWEVIDVGLEEDKNAADSGNAFGRALGNVRSWFSDETTFKTKANSWQVRFAPADAKQGMIRIGKGEGQISFIPVDANKDVKPSVTTNNDGDQVVRYKDLWPGVDVDYIVNTDAVKENIILKNKDAANRVAFKTAGAKMEEKVEKQKIGNYDITSKVHVLRGALDDEFAIAPANLILNNYGFVTDQSVFGQTFQDDTVTLSVSKDYLRSLPDNAFPAVIDPSTFYSTAGTRVSGNYVSFKSDGYVCYSYECNPYAGSLYDSNNVLRYWRSALYAPYSQLNDPNKSLVNATLHLKQRSNESFWTGDFDNHTYFAGHAGCLNGFHCLSTPNFASSGVVGATGSIDVTSIYQWRIGQGDFGAWLFLGGEDGTNHSFKNFDPGTGAYDSGSYVSFTYNGPPAAPSIQAPTANQVYVDPQPSFRVAHTNNPNGSTPLQYQLRVSSGPDGAGFLIGSPLLSSTQWTMPDNVLQDGSTYYIQARSFDPISGLYSDWGSSVAFRIDTRTGKNSTQPYATAGPVSVDLATGNLTTSAASHSSIAQGGSLGVSLNYNTPLKSRNGLSARYWNVGANYSGGVPQAAPDLTRVDQNINFDWDTGSPAPNIQNDWFYARWDGYFVAPQTGTYYFGGRHDDDLTVKVNNQQAYSATYTATCSTDPCYSTTAVTLTAGQVVPIAVDYKEATYGAKAQLYVKTPDQATQNVPSDWLQTGVRRVDSKKHGLTGSYFARLDGTNTFSANNYKVMERTDPYPSFNWGTGAPVPGGPNDFLIRWSGYVTVPEDGTYTFGTRSDDGTKIFIGNSTTPILSDWTSHGAPATPIWAGTGVTLSANTPTKITIEYYDEGGPASHELWIKRTNATPAAEQIVPSSWLSPQAQVLPDGWDLGIDGSGTSNYSSIKPTQTSAILIDSSGGTHEYIWTGSGYKPPVNEDGYLVRNTDGSFVLRDADGQTYVFAADGTISSVTSSSDDRNPSALQYEYQSLNGGPVHLYKIKDSVDPSRNMTLYYGGQSQCGTAPAGFDASAPAGMLCAAETNDGRKTHFYYTEGQLARVAMPGNAIVDYLYEKVLNDSGGTIGYRLAGVRDALANDAVAAGVRTNNDAVKTQIVYDDLGRVTGVTQPAPTAGASRMQQTIEYLPGAKAYLDENGSPVAGYAGMTKLHVVGADEPNGYTRRIKYDDLFRTTESTDSLGLSTTTEWHAAKDIAYSTTDATGLKSTTVYDDEDRPVSSYGPAPKAWFTTGTPNNQVPQSAYASQVPRSDATYDENIAGPAVSYFNYKATNKSLVGAPKLHTTGVDTSQPGLMYKVWGASSPITVDSGFDSWGMRMSGKLRVPTTGNYEFHLWHDDGATLTIDDRQVAGDWNNGPQRRNDGTIYLEAGKVYRFNIQYYEANHADSYIDVYWRLLPNGSYSNNFSSLLKPGYSLATSSKIYDSTVGDSTSTVSYGSTPELGLPQTISADPAGLNLTAKAAYEQPGATGSYLRPTSKSRPGDATNNPASSYLYYGATETADNPCTTATESYKQAGLVKRVTDASPDGGTTPGRKTETVYDDAGRVVAVRTNNDGWTCMTYDARGRVVQTVIPAVGSEAGRTITNNHAVYGDPTFTSTEDSSGVNVHQVDLLGRTIYYRDAQWNETWTGYDSLGRTIWRSSDVGEEAFVYDSYSRLAQHKVDNVTYAVVSYDQYGRTQNIEYPNAAGQKMVVSRDALGRLTGQTYYAGGAQTPGGNLVANPSVEQATGSPAVPQNWQNNAWGTNTPSFTYLNEGYTGDRSVKTEVTGYTDGDAKWYFDPVAVAPNTTYTFKDYYKSNIATGVVVQYTHQNQSVTYEWLGNVTASNDWKQSSLNFTTPATATHASVYHIVTNVGWLIIDDAELSANSSGSQSVIASDQVDRSQTGRIVSGTENGQTKSYTYDKAGRLTDATVGTDTYTYGYGAQSGSCATGTNANSGKNSNRTSQTVNGVTTTYCYDYADRLKTSSDPLANNTQYDSHGNMTQLGSGASPLRLYYDSSDRNWGMEQYNGSGNGNAVYYSRDVQGRIVHRETDSITGWNWTAVDEKWYGFTGNGDAPSFVRNANWDVVEKYLSLPGGVLLTVRPQQSGNAQKTYSLPNLQGSVMATTDASGVLTGTFRYDPFGNKLSTTLPNNAATGVTLGWAGQYGRGSETTLALMPIQMGARVYLPTLGRFAQTDPIPGGNANDYAYAIDPINSHDFTGRCLQCAAGANFLQPAAPAQRIQPAAPAPYYQPAAGIRAIQTVQRANLTVIRNPAPKPRDNSTAMPIAKVDAAWFASKAGEYRAGYLSGDGQREQFNYYQAAGAALAWSNAGAVAGAAIGCGVGAYFTIYAAGVGCVSAGLAGERVGRGLGAAFGFFLGGYGSQYADHADGLPEYHSPWK